MEKPAKINDVQPVMLQNLLYGEARIAILQAAIQFNIFALIAQNFVTLEKLSKQIPLPIRSIRMLLEALVGMGFLQKNRLQFKLGKEAETFLVPGSMSYLGAFASATNDSKNRWSGLIECLKTGRPHAAHQQSDDQKKFYLELVKRLFSVSYLSGVMLTKKMGVGKTLKQPKILDVACGSAAWSIPFAMLDKGTKVVGMDFPEMLSVAKSQVQKYHLDRQFEFIAADLKQQNFGVEQFDVIILGHIAHLLGEAETKKLLKKCYDALKPKGKIVVAEFFVNDLRTGPEVNLIFALNMLMMTDVGDVFAVKDFKRWLSFVGFKKATLQNVLYPTQVMLAVK